MSPPSDRRSAVTRELVALGAGDAAAEERLLALVYDELRDLAHAQMRRERGDHTLQATALVHEAWLRLFDGPEVAFGGKRHFYGAAGLAMRRILVEHARSLARDKRGAGARHVTLHEGDLEREQAHAEELVALDEMLGRLAAVDARKAQVVELRYFVGLSVEETARALDLSERTIKREWQFARAWLYREIESAGAGARDTV